MSSPQRTQTLMAKSPYSCCVLMKAAFFENTLLNTAAAISALLRSHYPMASEWLCHPHLCLQLSRDKISCSGELNSISGPSLPCMRDCRKLSVGKPPTSKRDICVAGLTSASSYSINLKALGVFMGQIPFLTT